jgi:hypothetical protein
MILYRFAAFVLALMRLSHAVFSRLDRPTFSGMDAGSGSNH